MCSELLIERKYGIKQAAGVLGLGVTTLRRMVRDGVIPVIRYEGKLIFLERDLEAFLQANYGPLSKASAAPLSKAIPDRYLNSSVLQKV